jgi:hypothetical protein
MWLRACLIAILIFAVGVERSTAADLSAVLTNSELTLNKVDAGNVVADRAQLSMAAFTETLGPPTRFRLDGRTQRFTWDDMGIQLEAIAPESTPFAVLFEFATPNSTNQGVIPSQPYRGTFDCLGISLSVGQRIDEQAKLLSAAGFNKDSGSASGQVWSLRLEHWAVFLQFSASGTIDSAVVRVLPDIY